MDHERLRRAQITESVLRHFHAWLSALLGGVATPEDTDRFLPMLTEAGIDLDNLQIAAFVLDGHGGDERPAGMPYFDTEQVEKGPAGPGLRGPAGRDLPGTAAIGRAAARVPHRRPALPVIAVPRLPVGAAVRDRKSVV